MLLIIQLLTRATTVREQKKSFTVQQCVKYQSGYNIRLINDYSYFAFPVTDDSQVS